VSFCIVDLHPASMSGQLPPIYAEAVRMLAERHGVAPGRGARLPDWQREISSDALVAMRPGSEGELERFMEYAGALLMAHVKIAQSVTPLRASEASRRRDVRDAHERFCRNMMMNKKTHLQLAMAFGEEAATDYMSRVMFDPPPREGSGPG